MEGEYVCVQRISFMLLSEEVILFYVEAVFILLNGEISALHFLASTSPLKPVLGSFFFPAPPHPYHFLCFAFQPLILPHLLSQEQNLLSNCLYLLIFLILILNQIPLSGPMQPLHTVTKFLNPVHLLAVNWFSIPDGRVSFCWFFF